MPEPKLCYPGFKNLLFLAVLFFASFLQAADVWSQPAFGADPAALRQAAASVPLAKDAGVTVLLDEWRLAFTGDGRSTETWHTIYRIETQDGAENWDEIRSTWAPWYQSRPEIKARVITPDGSVHLLDPKTLNDVPEHEDTPDVYSDQRAYGGPLPAIAPGVIVEEQIVVRDTQMFFKGGNLIREFPARRVPVQRLVAIIEHPESFPVRYAARMMPEAKITKSAANGIETVTIENGRLEAITTSYSNVPYDVVLHPVIELSTSESWRQVAVEYARLVQEKLRTADVQPLVSKIGTGEQAVSRIVGLLHKNVRYTGIEFGESSLVPQFPGETLKRKYGDCKDKSALLVAMLRAAGIPANIALLSSGPGLDVNPDMPGMGAFDHAIVYVPASGTRKELWIDATAQYSQVGSLPSMDYGRWALIADEKTTSLTKIPELTAEQNAHIETREFRLAGYGPAKVTEVNEGTGVQDSEYREFYNGDAKKLRENSEKYVQDAYLADSLGSMEKGDAGDLEKPFKVTLSATGRRGFTELDNATVYIPHASIFDEFPAYFRTREDERDKDENGEEENSKPQPRTVDWRLDPFITEWRYHVTAPDGFKIRAVPADKSEPIGSALLTRKSSASPDGARVEVVLRLESRRSRLTVDEGKALREAVLKARDAEGLMITFDQAGYALLSAGKVREALQADRKLVEEHPRDALHKVRLATALLGAGLGDKARAMAREATVEAPDSALAFRELGWILQHDLLGRRFHKGFDYEGAVAAYRKAKQLDPKDRALRADLAILLEHDAAGVRYSSRSRMAEAMVEYQELKKLSADYFHGYEDNIAYDLWYTEKFRELTSYLAELKGSDQRHAFAIAAIAATEGPEAAVKKSLEITSDEKDRSRVLNSAGGLLMKLRRYPEVAAMYRAAAPGLGDSGRTLAAAEILSKTRRYEELAFPETDPRRAIQRMFIAFTADDEQPERVLNATSKTVLTLFEKKDVLDEIQRTRFFIRKSLESSQVPWSASLDILLSNARYSVEGDDGIGYRITFQSSGVASQTLYVIREDGQYKALNTLDNQKSEALMALDLAGKNDLAGARKWLDWMRAATSMGGGDDPLAGPVFPRFWTKGQEGDAASVRIAALAALVSTRFIAGHVKELEQARDAAQRESEKNNLTLALAFAYQQTERWSDLRAAARELVQAFPESNVAYGLAVTADTRLDRLDDWAKLLEARSAKHGDEPEFMRSQSRLAMYRGNMAGARSILKSLMDSGKADAQDMNLYSWLALELDGKVDDESMETAERANNLTKNSNFAVLHTVACLYAARDKAREAREVLFKAMESGNLEEPNDAVWLSLGMIAGQIGEADAARELYSRVEKPKVDAPASSYQLAQKFLAALPKAPAPAPKRAAKF